MAFGLLFGLPFLLFGGFFKLLFMLFIVGIIFSVFRRRHHYSYNTGGMGGGNDGFGTSTSQRRSLDILEERYARGEITRDQFEQMRTDLNR
jgi:putative membrane protein